MCSILIFEELFICSSVVIVYKTETIHPTLSFEHIKRELITDYKSIGLCSTLYNNNNRNN